MNALHIHDFYNKTGVSRLQDNCLKNEDNKMLSTKLFITVVLFIVGLETFYDEKGASVRFSNLFHDLAENVPCSKTEQLKDLIESKTWGSVIFINI